MEVEVANNSCIVQQHTDGNCATLCIPMKPAIVDYCRNEMHECLRDGASDWDNFISILQKLLINFDKGFIEVCMFLYINY